MNIKNYHLRAYRRYFYLVGLKTQPTSPSRSSLKQTTMHPSTNASYNCRSFELIGSLQQVKLVKLRLIRLIETTNEGENRRRGRSRSTNQNKGTNQDDDV